MKMSSGISRCVVWYKFTDVSEVLAAIIIAMIQILEVFDALRRQETAVLKFLERS
jgi:hypothetical protein